MLLEERIDRIHARVQRNPVLQYVAAFTRLLLAVGFIAPGMHKAIGHPFITAEFWQPDDPIRLFFDAFFHAGEFYAFVGVIQVAAGILLLFHRTAPLGSVLYLPVIVCIFFVTLGLHFGSTTYIAGAMLLASTFLLCWYYPTWKGLAFPKGESVPSWRSATGLSVACGSWYTLAVAGVMLTLTVRSVIPFIPFYSLSLVLIGAAVLLGLTALVVNFLSESRRAV